MYRRLSQAAHRRNDDAGIGLIMVIGLTGVMTIIIGVLLTTVINSLAGSSRHNRFDLALTSAESGIDQSLSRMQSAYVTYGATYLSPNNSTTFDANPKCKASPIAWGGPFANADAERNWAIAHITALVKAHSTCLQHSENGDFATLAPSGVQAVYSMGWSPAFGDPKSRSRLIKAEYLFVPYAPSNAVLTGGNLTIDSSTTVKTPVGIDPCLAQIHSNGAISIGGGAAQLDGQVSATQGSAGAGYKTPNCTDKTRNTGKLINSPQQDIPPISAREVYPNPSDANDATIIKNYINLWYDLCPDGTVRPWSSDGTPCGSTTILSTTANSKTAGFRGWQFITANNPDDPGAALWMGQKAGISDGIYYVNAADVIQDNANPHTNSATIIAAATQSGPGICPKIGGNIAWGKNNFGGPAYPGMFMLADADLSTDSNFYAGSASGPGLFLAGDQVDLETSSNGAYGGVIAADQCTNGGMGITTNRIKNPTVTYVPNAAAPFTNTIDTSLWLEYPGSQ